MGQAFHEAAFEKPLGVRIAERPDHGSSLAVHTWYVKRKTDATRRAEESAVRPDSGGKTAVVVEAGGVEPPSEKARNEEPTCVAGS